MELAFINPNRIVSVHLLSAHITSVHSTNDPHVKAFAISCKCYSRILLF